MRRMVVECENGIRYEHELADGHRLKVTGKGNVWLIAPGERPVPTADLGSTPAVRVYELVPVEA